MYFATSIIWINIRLSQPDTQPKPFLPLCCCRVLICTFFIIFSGFRQRSINGLMGIYCPKLLLCYSFGYSVQEHIYPFVSYFYWDIGILWGERLDIWNIIRVFSYFRILWIILFTSADHLCLLSVEGSSFCPDANIYMIYHINH